MTDFGVDEAELRAARLALLALRANVPDDLPFRPDAVRIPPAAALLGEREAALSLALRSKPLRCYADVEDGVLTIVPQRLRPDVAPDHRFDESPWRRLLGRNFRERVAI